MNTTRTISCYLGADSSIQHEQANLTSGDCACGAYQDGTFNWDYHYSAKAALETGDIDVFHLVVQ